MRNPTRRTVTYVLGIVAAILFAALLSGGCAQRETKTARGWVVDKDYDPAWIQFIPISSGKTTIMSPVYHAEDYDILVAYVDTIYVWRDTNEEFYNATEFGDTVLVEVDK